MTIAIYLRISKEDPDRELMGKTESNSITNQRNLLIDFISQMSEWKSAEVLEFCDDGWSGKNFERPAVKEMLEKVKQGKIQCIVVKDFSRFGRDYLTVGNYLSRVFPFLGVRFIAVNDGFDSIRPMDIDSLETSFQTLLYDLYSRELSHKVKDARRIHAEKGDFLSPFAPYGYVKDSNNPKQLLIDSKAAQTVQRIFRLAADGQSTRQIAYRLNKEQVPTPMQYKRITGCPRTSWRCVKEENFWTQNTVTKILRDERYIGKNVYGKHMRDEVGKAHIVKVERKDWITVENTHKGIVSQEEFDYAQEQLQKLVEYNRTTSSKKGRFYKKVRCGICGHIMTRSQSKQPYYLCKTSYVTSAYSCGKEKIPECDLLEMVQLELFMQILCAVEMKPIWKEKYHWKEEDVRVLLETISSLKETHIKLERDIQELYEAFVLGRLDKAEYLTRKAVVIKKRDMVVVKVKELEAKLQYITAKMEIIRRYMDGELESHSDNCLYPYIEMKKLDMELISEVLEEIRVYPDNRLNIVWNYPENFRHLVEDKNWLCYIKK